MRIFLLIVFVTFNFSSLSAQLLSIKGRVISGREGIAYASVSLKNHSKAVLTDEKGYFSLEIAGGQLPVQLEIKALGHYKRTVNLSDTKMASFLTVSLEKTENQLNEVVVTGTMKEISRSESPVAVEVFSPAFFAKNPTPNLFDALQTINGVRPQLNCNVCNTGDIHINGMEGPYTMVLIDGMPIISSLSTVYGLSGIPNSIVDRIEVIKGPASALYGSEAIGGLINVITKAPANTSRLYVESNLTSHLESNTDLSFRYNITEKISSVFSANYFRFNSIRDVNHDGFTDVTLQNRVSVFHKTDFSRKNNYRSSIALRYLNESRWGGQTNYTDQFRGGDSIYAESIITNRFELIGNYRLPLKEQLTLQYSFNSHHQDSYYGIVPFNAIQQTGFIQLLADKRVSVRNDMLLGLSVKHQYYDDNTVATQTADLVNQPNIRTIYGAFIQNEWSVNEFNKLLFAFRVDHHRDHGFILSPRINHKWNFNQQRDVIRLGFGNGFRVVSVFTEDHAALTGARQVEIRAQLDPERSWNGTLNYQKMISLKDGFVNLDAGLFYTYFTNRIMADYDSDPDKIIYDNLSGYAVSRGMSLNSEFTFSFPFKAIAGFTLLESFSIDHDATSAVVRKDQYYASPFSGNFLLSYEFKKVGITIDYTGNIYSPMLLPVLPDDYRSAYSPWYSIQNLQVTKKFRKHFELYCGAKNLLNFIPKDPIMRAFDPFDKYITVNNPNNYTFDPGYMYAPVQGIRGFVGIRWKLS